MSHECKSSGESGWCLVMLVALIVLSLQGFRDRLDRIEHAVAPINSTIIAAVDSRVERGQ